MKWNMGGMNDTLDYVEKDPVHRKYHHQGLTYSLVYACTENCILTLSHDAAGRGEGSRVVVDATGCPAGLQGAMQFVRPRGTLVLMTMCAEPPSASPDVDLSPIVMKEISLLGSRSGPVGDAISMLARGAVDVVSLIGKRMTLNDGPAVLHAAAQPGMLKVLVDV